jgi:hypothetical protein
MATTYGFGHGIFSKYSFFTFWLDRAIKARLPEAPDPQKPVALRALAVADGWVGDFAPIGSWNPIMPAKQAKGLAAPVWFPDEYTAWGWRAFHSNCTDIEMRQPAVPYSKASAYSSDMANGYGGHLRAGAQVTCAAAVTGDYVRIEFYDGNIKLGEATAPSWSVQATLPSERGVRAIHAVGIRPDGSRAASRPAFAIAE